MKTLNSNKLGRPLFALAAVILALALALPAQAAPTVRAKRDGGVTKVVFDQAFLDVLTLYSVEVGKLGPGTILDGTKAKFEIAGGAVDVGPENNGGELYHLGGLRLSVASKTVELRYFTIDLTGALNAVLSGLVIEDGDQVGRVDLCDIEILSEDDITLEPQMAVINNAAVTLTAGAADFLNAAFGIDDFEEGLAFGTAKVKYRFKE